MNQCLLNIDLGELPDEDERLYALAHVANIACGGHAGDDVSIRRALERCVRYCTRAGAHPSFVDRQGFGRTEQRVAPDVLRGQLVEQCARLGGQASRLGIPIRFAKPHGALYHAANRDPALAHAVADAVVAALGRGVTLIGPAAGALPGAARAAGLGYAREGFADRATRPDGSLVPRGEPGAVITEPALARENAVRLATSGGVETICVHGDTAGAVAIAREVRSALDVLSLPLEPLGEAALRLAIPDEIDRGSLQEALLELPDVIDVVLAEAHAAVHFAAPATPADPRPLLARALGLRGGARETELVVVRVRYDGPDLERVAAHGGLRPEEVADLHAGREYTVRSVGFLPGFAYLGDVDDRIAAPRLPSPRPRVPAFAVGIAARRTGIYPFASPGGWNLIGTAVGFAPFDPERGARLQPGDRVRFERVA